MALTCRCEKPEYGVPEYGVPEYEEGYGAAVDCCSRGATRPALVLCPSQLELIVANARIDCAPMSYAPMLEFIVCDQQRKFHNECDQQRKSHELIVANGQCSN